MKRIVILLIVFSLVAIGAMASSYFSLYSHGGIEWSSMYSKKWGNLYFMGVIGNSGVGIAGGYITEIPIREKVGFLNPMVGKSTYIIALGMNLTQNVPAAYFKYELTHTLAPLIYDIQFMAGNYGLPNFGVRFEEESYLTLSSVSIYTREHSKLVFQTYMENFGLIDASFKNMKGTFIFTDEVGSVLSSTFGLGIGPVSFDVGLGYNGNPGLNFGISSAKSDMNGGWWLRFMSNDFGPTLLADLHFDNTELMAGYNRGAVYVSLER